jgi:hypothetical protein
MGALVMRRGPIFDIAMTAQSNGALVRRQRLIVWWKLLIFRRGVGWE